MSSCHFHVNVFRQVDELRSELESLSQMQSEKLHEERTITNKKGRICRFGKVR